MAAAVPAPNRPARTHHLAGRDAGWCNLAARPALDREVGGSSPPPAAHPALVAQRQRHDVEDVDGARSNRAEGTHHHTRVAQRERHAAQNGASARSNRAPGTQYSVREMFWSS
jgi:hypothetical protein